MQSPRSTLCVRNFMLRHSATISESYHLMLHFSGELIAGHGLHESRNSEVMTLHISVYTCQVVLLVQPQIHSEL